MFEWFIENGKIDQFKHADFNVWQWLLENYVIGNWDVILPWVGFFALFAYKRTRIYAISSAILAIITVI